MKLVEKIFPFQLKDASKAIEYKDHAVIMYDQTTCRQSLLLQCALTYASLGNTVCFIAPKPLASLPPTVHGMALPSPSNMRLIKFVYYPNYLDTVKMMSAMHMTTPLPSLIVIDELNNYFCQMMEEDDWEQTTSKFLSLLLDTANFISKKREEVCPVLVSCLDCPEFLKQSHLLRLFFIEHWQTQAAGNFSEDGNHYSLVIKNLRDLPHSETHANFYLTSSQLMLNNVMVCSR